MKHFIHIINHSARTAATLLLALLMLAAVPQKAWAQSPSGNWEDEGNRAATVPQSEDGSTLYISNAEELACYAYGVNHDWKTTGSASGYWCGRTVELLADIDLSAHYWKPIGWSKDYYFNGYFHGNGHVITGVHVNGDPQSDNAGYNYPGYGLFGYLHTRSGGTSTITDLVLKDFSITASFSGNSSAAFYLGGLVGRCDENTAITNCLLVNGSVGKNIRNSSAHIGKVAGGGSPSTATANYYHNVSVSGWNGEVAEQYAQQTIGGETEARAVALTISSTHGSVALGGTVGRISGGIIYAPANETVTLNTTADAGYIASLAATGLTLTSGQFTMPDNDDAAITATVSIDPAHFSVNDAGTEYTIHTAAGWNVFCDALQDNDTYNRFSGKTVRLGADIAVSRMAGSDKHDFCGTFDGDEHTITLDGNSANGCYTLFRNAVGATIRDLHVTGTITTAGKYAAGFISGMWGNVTIENCRSSVIIRSSVSGNGTHGGFVSVNNSGTLDITGCTFDGKLLTEGAMATSHCGGFVGRNDGTLTITNSLYAPADLADGETEISSEYTFARNGATLTNSYYTRALGTPQGKALRTIAAGDNVTIEAIALTGDATNYDVSGIIAYSGGGLQFGSALYYGSGDQLELTLSNTAPAAPLGYEYDGYTASAGTLSGSTLTMPDADVTISLGDLTVIDWATESAGDADHPYMIYNKDQLDLLAHRVNGTHGETAVEDGYSGKYFQLGADITYNHSTDWNDADCDQENNYEAIGGYYGSNYRSFSGDFDGADHTVSGIRIHRSGDDNADSYQGIFGMTMDANIHGLRLANARITGYRSLGGIAGYNYGTVTGCHVANNVCINAVQSDALHHGGIAGENRGTVANCTSAATLTIPSDATACWYYGAIAGFNNNDGTLRDNLAIGATVPAASGNTHGAIAGYNGGTLQRNYYTACKVASENVTPSGVGYQNADIAANDGAVPALRDQADNTNALALMAKLPEGTYPASFKRTFTAGKASTLCLPFAMSSIEGGKVYQLRDVTYDETDGEWVATMIDQSPEEGNLLSATEAGKPYLFMPETSDPVTFAGEFTVTEETATDGFVPTEASGTDGWTMKGTYERLTYGTAPLTGAIFGFASTTKDVDGVQVKAGEFVRAKDGAAVPALRAYLTYSGDNSVLRTRAAAADDNLPQSITVRLIGKDGSVTAIGTLTTDNGQLNFDTDGWYTLGGHRLSAKPTARGIYINNGKKVIVK